MARNYTVQRENKSCHPHAILLSPVKRAEAFRQAAKIRNPIKMIRGYLLCVVRVPRTHRLAKNTTNWFTNNGCESLDSSTQRCLLDPYHCWREMRAFTVAGNSQNLRRPVQGIGALSARGLAKTNPYLLGSCHLDFVCCSPTTSTNPTIAPRTIVSYKRGFARGESFRRARTPRSYSDLLTVLDAWTAIVPRTFVFQLRFSMSLPACTIAQAQGGLIVSAFMMKLITQKRAYADMREGARAFSDVPLRHHWKVRRVVTVARVNISATSMDKCTLN